MSVTNEAVAYPINITQSSLMVGLLTDSPVNLIGPPGCAKSSIVISVAKQLGWALFDFRMSDKEPPDLAGLPVADLKNKCVEWLQSVGLLPFKRYDSSGKLLPPKWKNLDGKWTDKCIVFFDELDRAMMEVLNVALQLILDRRVNGHEFYECVRIVAACNGESDIGTTQFSEALATRFTHLYIAHNSSENVDCWVNWARKEKLPAYALSFAKFEPKLVFGEDVSYPERAKSNARTFVTATKLLENCFRINTPWSTNPAVINQLIYGSMGRHGGNSLIAWQQKAAECPTPEDVFKNPKKAKLPKQPGLYFCTAHVLVDAAAPINEEGVAVEDRRKTRAFIEYVGRWPSEWKGQFWNLAKDRLTFAESDIYRKWLESQKVTK